MIRRETDADTGSIAEILVFNNRICYYPIFRDLDFSFGEYTVLAACREVRTSPEFAGGVYVWDDGVIRGFAAVVGNGIPAAKAEADAIVAPCLEDGFAEAVERFVLCN